MQLVAAQDVLVELRRGEQARRDVPERLVVLDLFEDLPAVPPRQVEVEQDQVGPDRVRERSLQAQVGQRLDTVVDHPQRVVDQVLLERLPRHEDVAGIVLDEQHLDRSDLRGRVSHGTVSSAGATAATGSAGAGDTGVGSAGRVKRIVVPWATDVSSQMRPPWYSMIFFAMARPIPVPG